MCKWVQSILSMRLRRNSGVDRAQLGVGLSRAPISLDKSQKSFSSIDTVGQAADALLQAQIVERARVDR
jgi:hypothetical protein